MRASVDRGGTLSSIGIASVNLHLSALVLFGVACLGFFSPLRAQPANPSQATLEQQLAHAKALLSSARNDSTLVVTGNLLKVLRAQERVNSPLGIRVQLLEATALEQDKQDDLALEKLLAIEQRSQQQRLRELHARACLELALVYEKARLYLQSKEQLISAKADIDQYELETVYPLFAVRMASWERQFGDRKAALSLARQAVQTASRLDLPEEEADGHLLISALLPKEAFDERMSHSLAAVRLFKRLHDTVSVGYMFEAIVARYTGNRNFRQALHYADSTAVIARQMLTEGNDLFGTDLLGQAYERRAAIYEQTGLLDSALFYMQKSLPLLLEAQQKESRDKVAEVESRYQNQAKQKQIEEQQLALNQKNQQLRFSVIIVLLVVASAIGLGVSYRRLARQNILIQQQTSQLKALDVAKSRFFANVSHELRTPLTLLLGPISTLLNQQQLSGKQISLLQIAHQSGRQLQQLITNILDLGKLELGKLELDLKPTSVASFLRAHLAPFESLAQSRNLQYDVNVAIPDETVASLDQPKCRQIINNLLANAVKFTPSGGRITASASLNGEQLHLSVADTGPGIHPDDLPHLFDRYFQTTRPDKSAEGGTGIGLALCQEYAHLMGGTIGVESTPGGQGAVFRVAFPVAILPAPTTEPLSQTTESDPLLMPTPTEQPRGTAPVAGSKKPSKQAVSKPAILVAEDNVNLQAYIRLILEEKYEVVSAENGQVALDCIRDSESGRFSLVLSDLMMPIMDGHQLLLRLKANEATRHLPVIMLTARADARDKLRSLRVGVDDYLLKPFEEEELLARIDNLLTNLAVRRQADAEQSETTRPMKPQPDAQWLELFEAYVQQHLTEPNLSVPELAHRFAMSESTLLRQLKRLTGLSPVQYVQMVRLESAWQFLESGAYDSVAQVAAQVGYDNARSFSQSFRARFGKLPSELLET